MFFLRIFYVLFGCLSSITFGQEFPPIQNYSPQDYNGETQNWSISQDQSNTMYFANNKGLLSFNGERWNLIPSPNESIIRSLNVINNRIYGGMYMEFGYWEINEFGTLDYTSLSTANNLDLIEDEQFWKIISLQNWILFQSLNRIYAFNSENGAINIIEAQSGITKMFKTNENIYFQKTNNGLYKIENGKEILINDNKIIRESRLISVIDNGDSLLIQTQDNGFYELKSNSISEWNTELNTYLSGKSIYSSIKLNNDNFALGTISHGLLFVDSKGNFLSQIDQSQGLGNNTILSLFEDKDGNLWMGSDDGISCLNLNAPFKVFNDYNGQLGSVYTSAIFNGKLYIGTNQGLFYKDMDSSSSFKFIEGTQGQVWSLTVSQNQLFCGHDSGTFLIEPFGANKISNIEGAWNIKPVPNNPNLMIQGNYSGLYVLKKNNSAWKVEHKIKNYDISSRYFEFVKDTEILVSHEYKGIIRLELNSDLSEAISVHIDDNVKGLKSSLAKHNDTIYYAYNKGILKYDVRDNRFVKDSLLSDIIKQQKFVSGKLITDPENNRLWLFSDKNINYIEPGNLSSIPKLRTIPLPYQLINSVSGYENLLPLKSNKYLIGSTSGYLILDLEKLQNKSYDIQINTIKLTKNRDNNLTSYKSKLNEGYYDNDDHILEFDYSMNAYNKYFRAEYQYKLEGLYDNWSKWSLDAQQDFENLPYGNYTFNVRGKINGQVTSNIARYNFSIKRPWYTSNLMLAVYLISVVLFSLIMHNIYRQYYKKQKRTLLNQNRKEIELKDLENQKRIMRIQNENLERDIENKNRELAISTMSLIKKNEFLNTVKQELKKVNTDGLKQVIKIIDKNLNNTDDWKLFEEAFNNADKDFLKKIKLKHPGLTPNDLRLCAYLRLNLSSKEIAPLLNISPRSVEVKRYRLRKKMNLAHEASLTNYIIEI